MLKRSTSLVALTFISSVLALTGVACSNQQTRQSEKALSDPRNAVNAVPPSITKVPAAIQPQPITALNQPSQYDLALDKANGAISISQSAQSSDDWQLVASQLEAAIAQLQALPNNNPDKAIAKTKIAQYQRHLIHAQQQANYTIQHHPDPVVAAIPDPAAPIESQAFDLEVPQPVAPQNQQVFQATIKRRVGGTPVIDVTFNGIHKFEMIVDTGASGTVLTQQTAETLKLVPVATAKANTASAKAVEFPIGYVSSIAVDGVVARDIPVAIAPSAVLETGLLGHDFFGNYDVTIRRDVIEFRSR